MLKTIHALTIIAFLAFITCCVFWIVKPPGRYQSVGAAMTLDTRTGTLSFVKMVPGGQR